MSSILFLYYHYKSFPLIIDELLLIWYNQKQEVYRLNCDLWFACGANKNTNNILDIDTQIVKWWKIFREKEFK